MRKVSVGVVGGPILGQLTALDNVISSIEANQDLNLTPNGTGEVKVNSHLQINAQDSLKFADADSSNFVGLQSPTTVTSNVTYTLPGSYTDGYFMRVDASGNLSWEQAVFGVTDQAASSSSFYPILTTQTSGDINAVDVSSSKLSFVPSTGTLSCTNLSCTDVTASGDLQALTITETSSLTLKENIVPIENALDKIVQLCGKIYDRKDGSIKDEAGLLAEEVDPILPNIVLKDKKGAPESIQYTRLGPYLVEAVKELKQEIDSIKEKLNG